MSTFKSISVTKKSLFICKKRFFKISTVDSPKFMALISDKEREENHRCPKNKCI